MNIKSILSSKKKWYIIVIVFFVVLFLFLDEYNIIDTIRLKSEVNDLKKQEAELEEGIVSDSIRVSHLIGDLDALERFGREEYYMKRSDEDVYVINKEK